MNMVYHHDFEVWFAAESGKCTNCGGDIAKGEIILDTFAHENALDVCSRNKGVRLGLKPIEVNNYGKIKQALAYVSADKATEEEVQRYLNKAVFVRNIKDLLQQKIEEYTADLIQYFGKVKVQ